MDTWATGSPGLNFASSQNDKPLIGWFCTYTPEELILAAGLESKRILAKTANLSTADNYLHPNLCGYVRACFASLLDYLPCPSPDRKFESGNRLSGIVGIDSCDAMRRLFDSCQSFLPITFSHILTLPHAATREAVQFYQGELESFADVLQRTFAVEFGPNELLHAINLMNETRTLLHKLNELHSASALPDMEYYQILQQAMTAPKEEFNRSLRQRLEQIKIVPQEGEQIKLILSGGVLDDLWLVSAIEEAGGCIVADDLCCGSRYFENPVQTGGDLLFRIAERYIYRSPCARMSATERRTEHLLGLLENTGAGGVIYYSLKFCDPHTLDWTLISQELQKRGVPSLRCEGDYSTGAREQVRTRLQAFLEMMK